MEDNTTEPTVPKRFCSATRGEPVELPTGPGFWVERHPNGGESVYAVVLRDGELRWHCNGRPLMRFDRGIFYGPYRLANMEGE